MDLFDDFIENRNVLINKVQVLSLHETKEDYYLQGYRFLQALFRGMASLSIKYFDRVDCGELPYQYRERQLDSIILPVLSQICGGAVLAEMPALRKYRIEGESGRSSGRIDYWCIFGGYSFVVEVKHGTDTFTTIDTTSKVLKNRWHVMTKYQLNTISSELKSYMEPTKGVIRLGIQFVNSTSSRTYDKSMFKEYRSSLPEILDRLCCDLSGTRARNPKPDFAGYWIPPLRMRENLDTNIPGFLLFAKIYEPIHHKGAESVPEIPQRG